MSDCNRWLPGKCAKCHQFNTEMKWYTKNLFRTESTSMMCYARDMKAESIVEMDCEEKQNRPSRRFSGNDKAT